MAKLWTPPNFGNGIALNASQSEFPNLWNGLVGSWNPGFGHQGIGTLWDYSGYSNNGTLNGSMTNDDWVVGPYGPALDLDGTNDTISKTSFTQITGYPFTLVSRFKVTSASQKLAISIADAASNVRYHGLGANSNYLYSVSRGDVGEFAMNPTAISIVNNWTHAALVCESATLRRLYLNGVQAATDTGSVSWNGVTKVSIGVACRNSQFGYFLGQVAMGAVYSLALLPSEILALYQGASPHTLGKRSILYFDQGGAATTSLIWNRRQFTLQPLLTM